MFRTVREAGPYDVCDKLQFTQKEEYTHEKTGRGIFRIGLCIQSVRL